MILLHSRKSETLWHESETAAPHPIPRIESIGVSRCIPNTFLTSNNPSSLRRILAFVPQPYYTTMSSSSDASSSRPPVEGQLSTLPGTTTHLTGHDEQGKAVVHESRLATWKAFDDKVCYSELLYLRPSCSLSSPSTHSLSTRLRC